MLRSLVGSEMCIRDRYNFNFLKLILKPKIILPPEHLREKDVVTLRFEYNPAIIKKTKTLKKNRYIKFVILLDELYNYLS